MSQVTHAVSLRLKPETAEEASSRFFGLKSLCRKPDGTTYVIDVKGGADISIEGFQNGFTHIFFVTFASVEDRDYYVTKDPAHTAFVGYLLGEALQAVNAEAGEKAVFVMDIKGGWCC